MTPSDGKLLTTKEAAALLGVSSRTLVRYAEKGYVTPTLVLPSGHRRWDVEEVRRQLKSLPRDEN